MCRFEHGKNAQYGNYTDPLICYINSYRYKTIIETTIVVLNDHALFFVKYNDQKNDLHEPCLEVNMISCSMMDLGGSDIQSPCNILGWLLGFITKFFLLIFCIDNNKCKRGKVRERSLDPKMNG